MTPVALDEKFAVPGHDAAAPTFVHVPPLDSAGAARVHLPPVAPAGEHPRLLLTRQEVAQLRADLPKTERGRQAFAALIRVADAALAGPVDFPDPEGPPAQMTDRGDAVAKRHDRLALDAGTLGIAHALTGDAKYARRAAQTLLGYAQRYAAYPKHKGVNRSDTGKVMGQRLSEAMWLIPLLLAYDYIHDSGVLTAADRERIEGRLLRPAIAFIRRKEPAAEVAERDRKGKDWRTAAPGAGSGKAVGNWLNYYNAATMMAGAVMGDRDMVDLAAADFRGLLAQGIGSDGMWGEGAIGYQFFALTAMVTGLEAAARQGAAGAHPGVLLDRTVVVTPDAVLDLYHGRSATGHAWDRTFRYAGPLIGFTAGAAGRPLGERDGYQHLQAAERRPAGQTWQAAWQTGVGRLHVTLAGAPGQQVIPATGPDREQMALARQEGERADFAAVLAMEAWRNPVESARLVPTGDPDTTGFEMTQKNGALTQVIVAHGAGPWQAMGWRSDARVLYVRQHGRELRVLLGGGTFARADAAEIRQTAPGNYYAERRGAKLEVVSAWTKRQP